MEQPRKEKLQIKLFLVYRQSSSLVKVAYALLM